MQKLLAQKIEEMRRLIGDTRSASFLLAVSGGMDSMCMADLFLNEVAFVDRMFGGFIDGKILDSAIMGALCYVGCSIFRFPNPLLVSAIVGITNVIPFFGPFIGGIPATLLIMIEDPIKGLWFAVFVLALQQLDGNVIGPTILGDKTGLPSMWVIFAILVGGSFFGVVGMFFGVPVCACIYSLVTFLVEERLKKKSLPVETDVYSKNGPVKPETPENTDKTT